MGGALICVAIIRQRGCDIDTPTKLVFIYPIRLRSSLHFARFVCFIQRDFNELVLKILNIFYESKLFT